MFWLPTRWLPSLSRNSRRVSSVKSSGGAMSARHSVQLPTGLAVVPRQRQNTVPRPPPRCLAGASAAGRPRSQTCKVASGEEVAGGASSSSAEASGTGRNVVVAVDASDDSVGAFEWTLKNLYRAGDSLHLLHVVSGAWSGPGSLLQPCTRASVAVVHAAQLRVCLLPLPPHRCLTCSPAPPRAPCTTPQPPTPRSNAHL